MTIQEAIENVALKRKSRERAAKALEKARAEWYQAEADLVEANAQLETVTNRLISEAS